MQNVAVKQIESLLNFLVQARKTVLMYPPKHPSLRRALNTVIQALDALSPQENESGDRVHEEIVLKVSRTGFLFMDEAIATQYDPVCRFAQGLYRQGVKAFWIRPGLAEEELEEFLLLTCRPSGENASQDLRKARYPNIGVEIIDTLHVVERDDPAAVMDMLEYLRQRQALRRSPEEEAREETPDLPYDDSEDISELVQFFHDIAEGSGEKREFLLNTLSDSARVAETLTYVSSLRTDQADSESPVSIAVLRQTLRHIGDNVRGLPKEQRDAVVKNIAEAIGLTDRDTHETITLGTLAPQLGRQDIAEKICEALPDGELAEILSAHVRLHNGTANTISNVLEALSGDGSRREAITGMLLLDLSRFDDVHVQEVRALLERRDSAGANVKRVRSTPNVAERDRIETKHEDAAAGLSLNAREAAELESAVKGISKTEVLEKAALTLLDLQAQGQVANWGEPALFMLCEALDAALLEGHYGFVSRCLELALEQTPPDTRIALRKALKPFIVYTFSGDVISQIIDRMLSSTRESTEYGRMGKLLSLVGEPAFQAVFDGIATEKIRSRRQCLLDLFLGFGEDTLYFLCRNIEHRDWFVVRNVAYLLGQLELEPGLDALERVLYHADMRVRREVIRAIATIRGPRAEGILIRCLSDSEPVIGGLAAEWMGIMHAGSVLPLCRRMLESDYKNLRRQPDLAIGMIRAVRRLGAAEDAALLHEFSGHVKGFGIRRRDEMLKACEDAIAEIQTRSAVGPPTAEGKTRRQ